MRGGTPIKNVPLRHGTNPGISYSQEFELWQAATAAGLNMWKVENRIYPNEFLAKCIVWHRLHGLVEAHSQDAAIKAK
jgi:hypothetical protein